MKKVYVILGCFSGEDYSTDDPVVYEVCETLEGAKIELGDIISDIKDGFSDNCDYSYSKDATEFEFTDFINEFVNTVKKDIMRHVKM